MVHGGHLSMAGCVHISAARSEQYQASHHGLLDPHPAEHVGRVSTPEAAFVRVTLGRKLGGYFALARERRSRRHIHKVHNICFILPTLKDTTCIDLHAQNRKQHAKRTKG